ncbi:hypothetical protein BDF19DRAFT_415038 [Syncephalis fuscata]|nr:hypothetical protein BDF19DRAFT_415038 [Syncephalis fuscata]
MSRKHNGGNTGDRVVFKADNGDEFFIFVDPDMFLKRKKDTSVPLVDVVQTFDVFATETGGNDGKAGRASMQSLSNALEVSNVDDAIQYIIDHGQLHGRQDLGSTNARAPLNISRGYDRS